MPRTVKEPAKRRRELIECARHFFYTKGYQSTSVSDIVGEIGVAQGTFYYYFNSKQEILEAIVEEISEQALAIMDGIVTDDTLTALQKWEQALALVGAWKLERKSELLAILEVMAKDENALLRQKVQEQSVRLVAPAFGRIIAQGVEEGVFDTPFPEESAEIVLAIVESIHAPLSAVLLNPGDFDNPVRLAERKFAAVESAVERILGATPGAITLVDPDLLAAWISAEGRDQERQPRKGKTHG